MQSPKFRLRLQLRVSINTSAVSNIGPQTSFPVPEGIINHQGGNYLALTIWALDAEGAHLTDIKLTYEDVILSGYKPPHLVEGQMWKKRTGSY